MKFFVSFPLSFQLRDWIFVPESSAAQVLFVTVTIPVNPAKVS